MTGFSRIMLSKPSFQIRRYADIALTFHSLALQKIHMPHLMFTALLRYGFEGHLLRTEARACPAKLVERSRMAERAGFEPALRSPVNTLSRRAPSTTRPPLRPCMSRRPVLPCGLGRCTSLGQGGTSAIGVANQQTPSPAPEPSKQQARGSSSRSGAECQAITAVYSLCRPHSVSQGRRHARFCRRRRCNGVHRQDRRAGRP